MTTQTVQTVEQGIERRALTMVEAAKCVQIVDAESYISAGEAWKRLAEMEKEAHEHFDPVVKSTNQAHKDAVALRTKVLDPIEKTKLLIKSKMSNYDLEQARIALAEQNRLQEIVRKQEEDAVLALAIDAEASGDKAESEAILAEPIQAPVVTVQKEVPKMAGGPVYQTRWDADLTQANLIAIATAIGKGELDTAAIELKPAYWRGLAQQLHEEANKKWNAYGIRAFPRRV